VLAVQNLVSDNEKAFHRGYIAYAINRFVVQYESTIVGSEVFEERFVEAAGELYRKWKHVDVRNSEFKTLQLMVDLNDFCDAFDAGGADTPACIFSRRVRARVRLCTFHVLKAWNQYFKQRVYPKRWKEVHACLRSLLEAPNREEFGPLLQGLVAELRREGTMTSVRVADAAVKYLSTTYSDGHLPRKREAEGLGA
jgi:hypothetical protein